MDVAYILIASGMLHMSLLLMHGAYIAYAHGIHWGTGRRTTPQKLTDLDRRFDRTISNSFEGMIAFVPVLLGAMTLDALTPFSLWAAQMFVVARATFAILYLADVPYFRTVAWILSMTCIAAVGITALIDFL